jgi:hypothetical protein
VGIQFLLLMCHPMRAPRALEENRWKTNRMFVLVTRDMDVASERQRFSEARRKWGEMGRLSFGYFSLAKQRKVTRQEAK